MLALNSGGHGPERADHKSMSLMDANLASVA
jgi:hypothetical protein